MHIEELHLENFRGFKELTLKFPSNLAVIIGVNGSGKSSILDSLSILLTNLSVGIIKKVEEPKNKFYGIASLPLTDYRGIEWSDVNSQATETKATFCINLDDAFRNSFLGFGDEYDIKLALHSDTNRAGLSGIIQGDMSDQFENFIFQKLKRLDSSNIPIILHYRANRFADYIELKALKPEPIKFPQLYAYQGCTSIKQNDFTTFFQWFRTQEDIENEERLEVNPDYRDKQLEAVKRAIISLLGNDYINLRVKRTSNQMIVHKKGEELSVSQLSDGEKGLLAMVGDMARRLAIANPSLDNSLEGEGVILIDEIELHLHPQWQRKIIPNLTKTFPNCQFIVTTHSPQVLSNVHKENVFIIEDFQLVEHTPHTYGRDSNSILFELMGVSDRIPEVQKQIDSCLQLIDDDKLDQAKVELKILSDLLGEDDSEIVRANTLLDFFHRIE
jgi:predicted ATP-binding protein involved in virulence